MNKDKTGSDIKDFYSLTGIILESLLDLKTLGEELAGEIGQLDDNKDNPYEVLDIEIISDSLLENTYMQISEMEDVLFKFNLVKKKLYGKDN